MKFKNEKHYWCQSWVDKGVLTFSYNSIVLLLLDSDSEQELMLKVGSIWLFTSGKNI